MYPSKAGQENLEEGQKGLRRECGPADVIFRSRGKGTMRHITTVRLCIGQKRTKGAHHYPESVHNLTGKIVILVGEFKIMANSCGRKKFSATLTSISQKKESKPGL